MLIKNAKILTMHEGQTFENGYILIEGGKISEIGDMRDAPQDGDNVDAQGGYVIPGLIDAHCHLGIFGDSMGFEGSDGNEDASPVTPHLRAIDAINPMDRCFGEARAGGVTTVVTGPGSANILGGQMAAIKTCGIRIDDMIVKAPCAMKCALGENPKMHHGKSQRSPVTRMATAALLREALSAAMSYHEQVLDLTVENPPADLKNEALLGVLKGAVPLHVHAHRADDIFTALRIAGEYGVGVKIVHATDGHLIADILAKEGVDVMVGPLISIRSKPEMQGLIPETAAILERAGVRLAITTDHPEVPVDHLLLCMRLAVKSGMSEAGALRAVTCDAAAIAGIGNRVGRLQKGYDADMVILDNHPLDFHAKIRMTIINGVKVYKDIAR